MLKEQFHAIIRFKGVRALLMLEQWLDWQHDPGSTPSSNSADGSARTLLASKQLCFTTSPTGRGPPQD